MKRQGKHMAAFSKLVPIFPRARHMSVDARHPLRHRAPHRHGYDFSVTDQAEGMSCRIGVDVPGPAVEDVQWRRTQSQDPFPCPVQVRDAEVQMELLGVGGIGPLRRAALR